MHAPTTKEILTVINLEKDNNLILYLARFKLQCEQMVLNLYRKKNINHYAKDYKFYQSLRGFDPKIITSV